MTEIRMKTKRMGECIYRMQVLQCLPDRGGGVGQL